MLSRKLIFCLSFLVGFVLFFRLRSWFVRNTNTSADLLNELTENSRVLCWIVANPANEHKWKHLKNLYGKNCDKFLIMTSLDRMKHIDGLEIFGLDVPEGTDHLAERCYKGFQYVYEQYYNDYDYFMRADEDTYFVIKIVRGRPHMMSRF